MMTKPEILMYWMMNYSEYKSCLTLTDRVNLVSKGLFNDLKAVSNAVYQLKKNGYVCDTYGKNSILCLTERGLDHMVQVIKRENSAQEPQPEKKAERDFEQEIKNLQEENAQLRQQNKDLADEIVELRHALLEMHKKNSLETCKKNDAFEQCAGIFVQCAKVFNDIASQFK